MNETAHRRSNGDALRNAAEALVEQLIEKGNATLAKEQALLDLLTRDEKMADPPSTKDS